MGGCSKTLKFVITIITWWVGVTKKWNCSLLFVTNHWCLQFFCKNVTSQLLKQEKRAKAIAKGPLILNNCETKKYFIVLHNNIVVLTKRKKLLTSFVCFLLSSFWKVGRKNNSAWTSCFLLGLVFGLLFFSCHIYC